MEEYRLSEAYDVTYHFVRDDFADWYIETCKLKLNPGVLQFCLESVLKLVHPFAPFVSETIWQTLPHKQDDLLMLQAWPTALKFDMKKAQQFEELQSIITEVRAITAAMQLKKTKLYYTDAPVLDDNEDLVTSLARIDGTVKVSSGNGLYLTSTTYTCWLDIDHEQIERYRAKLQDDLRKAQARRDGLEQRLNNKKYTTQAPKKLVEETRQEHAQISTTIASITSEIERFETA